MAEKLKVILLFIIILSVVTLLGYWSIVTLNPASVVVEKQKQAELEKENGELKRKVAELTNQLRALEDAQTEETDEPSPTTAPAASKYQGLINDLEKLVTDNVFMKEKSQGARVGTVQTFLNIYNNTSKLVDNDYGPGTKTDVMNFQKAESITADGEAGPGTFRKMIEWLKKQ